MGKLARTWVMTSSSHSGLSDNPYSRAAKARMPGIKETATGVRNQVMPINCAERPNRNIPDIAATLARGSQ
jgi:hypothetical protein